MRIPVLQGMIKRRMLINFLVDPEVMRRQLPAPFRPKIYKGHAIAGICLIRLEQIRPAGFPALLGLSSENAAHRVAVEWTESSGEQREGVYILRRDTGSRLNNLTGGRLFSGEHNLATFRVLDDGTHVDFSMESRDKAVSVRIRGFDSDSLPPASAFGSLAESSRFFEGGSLGYSATRRPHHLDGLRLKTMDWRVRALTIEQVESSFFTDTTLFPASSVQFDHALIMREIQHEWHQAESLITNVERPVP